jgi:hypothetical protein
MSSANQNQNRNGKQAEATASASDAGDQQPIDLGALYEMLMENNDLLRLGFAAKIAAAERRAAIQEQLDMGAPVPLNVSEFFRACATDLYPAELLVPLALKQRARAELAAQETATPDATAAKKLRVAWQQVTPGERGGWKTAFLALQTQMIADTGDTDAQV